MKLEAHHIRAAKGQRPLTQINVRGTEMAEAATAAAIDIIVSGYPDQWPAIRAAAPGLHLCLSLRHGDHADPTEVSAPPLPPSAPGVTQSIAPSPPASSNRSRAKASPSAPMRALCPSVPASRHARLR